MRIQCSQKKDLPIWFLIAFEGFSYVYGTLIFRSPRQVYKEFIAQRKYQELLTTSDTSLAIIHTKPYLKSKYFFILSQKQNFHIILHTSGEHAFDIFTWTPFSYSSLLHPHILQRQTELKETPLLLVLVNRCKSSRYPIHTADTSRAMPTSVALQRHCC